MRKANALRLAIVAACNARPGRKLQISGVQRPGVQHGLCIFLTAEDN